MKQVGGCQPSVETGEEKKQIPNPFAKNAKGFGKSAGRLYWRRWYRGTTARGTRGGGEYRSK